SIQTRSAARIWFPLSFGFILGIATFMIYKCRHSLISLLKTLMSRKSFHHEDITGFPSNLKLLAIFLAASSSSIILFHYLVPEIPLWIPAFISIIYSFLVALVTAATQGETGMSLNIGNVWSIIVYLSFYNSYAGYVFAPSIAGEAAGTFSQRVKVALTLSCKPSDLPKLQLIAWSLTWLFSIVVFSVFWSIAPIPSIAYPATLYDFPQQSQSVALLMSRALRILPEYVSTSMISVIIVSCLGEILYKIGIPFSHTGFFLGLFSLPATAVPMLIGSAIGNFVMPRFFGGKENWRRVRGTIIAGELMGEGVTLIFLLSTSLLGRASWIWPW
ncbi:MAG: hypothetical protein QXU67_04300, partial [Candidatus Bathyarchaeia archaeon]